MVNKKRTGLTLLVLFAFGFIAVGCSSFPKTNLSTRGTTYDVLGFLDGPFRSYAEALAAARKTYPSADGVIVIKSSLNDRLLPKGKKLGYFAVKFKAVEPLPQKRFLGFLWK
jgi:hypothetical protein